MVGSRTTGCYSRCCCRAAPKTTNNERSSIGRAHRRGYRTSRTRLLEFQHSGGFKRGELTSMVAASCDDNQRGCRRTVRPVTAGQSGPPVAGYLVQSVFRPRGTKSLRTPFPGDFRTCYRDCLKAKIASSLPSRRWQLKPPVCEGKAVRPLSLGGTARVESGSN